MEIRVKSLNVFPLAVPMKRKVEHASHERATADPIVVRAELDDGTIGYGETLARPYVTGETRDACIDAIRTAYADHVADFSPNSFADAVRLLDALPFDDDAGRSRNASRAGVELALLDAYSKAFGAPITDAAAHLGLDAFRPPGSIHTARCTGVLASKDFAKIRKTLRLMRCGGFRSFKLKVALPDDDRRVRFVASLLGRGLASGRCTLRVDANGGWSADDAINQLNAWRDLNLHSVEQPLAKGREADLPRVKAATSIPLLHDESLTSMRDAEALHAAGVADLFNVRIAKCGGWLASLRIAKFAADHGVGVVFGCLVGETSILSAAQRRFLEVVPNIAQVEGNFGTFLLTDDVIASPLRFGYAGRLKPLPGAGWGIAVDPSRIASLADATYNGSR